MQIVVYFEFVWGARWQRGLQGDGVWQYSGILSVKELLFIFLLRVENIIIPYE